MSVQISVLSSLFDQWKWSMIWSMLDAFTWSTLFGCVVSEHKMYMHAADGGKVYFLTKCSQTQRAFNNIQLWELNKIHFICIAHLNFW